MLHPRGDQLPPPSLGKAGMGSSEVEPIMPGEPKRRHSKSRKRTRRAAIKLAAVNLVLCKNCGKPTLPHVVCQECGFYGGKAITKERVQVTKA